jgi:hypothetical protein
MSAREPTAAEVEAGHAIYTPALLAFYDVLVLQLSCRFAWGCPPAEILAVYERHIGARHLDVGVSTGFFLDRCRSFSNLDDDADGLRRGLAAELADPQIEFAGTVALFSAPAAP